VRYFLRLLGAAGTDSNGTVGQHMIGTIHMTVTLDRMSVVNLGGCPDCKPFQGPQPIECFVDGQWDGRRLAQCSDDLNGSDVPSPRPIDHDA